VPGEHRDRVDQMTQRAVEAIHSPDDERVAFSQMIEQPRQVAGHPAHRWRCR
jgi:hypothetical protein